MVEPAFVYRTRCAEREGRDRQVGRGDESAELPREGRVEVEYRQARGFGDGYGEPTQD